MTNFDPELKGVFMLVALYSKQLDEIEWAVFKRLTEVLGKNGFEVVFSSSFKKYKEHLGEFDNLTFYEDYQDLKKLSIGFFITVGGDGTFLDSLIYVKDLGIPVLGINKGRLGFLSNNAEDRLEEVVGKLRRKEYQVENRNVLELESNYGIFPENNYALNDFTVHKRDNSSLTTISAYLNDEPFNTYWGDGIIVSTATGSTAYSLSCGGPVVFPESSSFILTAVAPHNLNIRPVIVPDHYELRFEIKGREKNFLVSLDSRYEIVDQSYRLKIKKAPFQLKTIRFNDQTFSKIIREKLMWGIDNRNF